MSWEFYFVLACLPWDQGCPVLTGEFYYIETVNIQPYIGHIRLRKGFVSSVLQGNYLLFLFLSLEVLQASVPDSVMVIFKLYSLFL